MLGKIKDNVLKEAMDELAKEAREYCEENGLDPEKAVFTLEIYYNLVKDARDTHLKGTEQLKTALRCYIADDGCEAIMFVIDNEAGLSFSERERGEKYIKEEKYTQDSEGIIKIKGMPINAGIDRLRKMHSNSNFVFAEILKADAHVRLGIFDRKNAKFFYLK
jgi:hypothetical protein